MEKPEQQGFLPHQVDSSCHRGNSEPSSCQREPCCTGFSPRKGGFERVKLEVSDRTGLRTFQAYLSRDEAQAMIARVLAEKDTLRCQLMELQERFFSLQSRGGTEQQHVITHSSRRRRRGAGSRADLPFPPRSHRWTGRV